jgi:hypothetical protein
MYCFDLAKIKGKQVWGAEPAWAGMGSVAEAAMRAATLTSGFFVIKKVHDAFPSL